MTIKLLYPDHEVSVEHARDVFEVAYSHALLQDTFHCVVDTGFRGADVLDELFQSVLAITTDLNANPVDQTLFNFVDDYPRALVGFSAIRKPGEFRLDLSARTIDPDYPDQSPLNMDNTLCLVLQRIVFIEDMPDPVDLAK